MQSEYGAIFAKRSYQFLAQIDDSGNLMKNEQFHRNETTCIRILPEQPIFSDIFGLKGKCVPSKHNLLIYHTLSHHGRKRATKRPCSSMCHTIIFYLLFSIFVIHGIRKLFLKTVTSMGWHLSPLPRDTVPIHQTFAIVFTLYRVARSC